MDRLIAFLVVLLLVALALPTIAAAAQTVIPALLVGVIGLIAIRSVP
jgi:hypothetical protein